jgi:hypothetical protein
LGLDKQDTRFVQVNQVMMENKKVSIQPFKKMKPATKNKKPPYPGGFLWQTHETHV